MRKEITITLNDNGNPLKFKIKQMPATKQEMWIAKALILLARSGVASKLKVPDNKKLTDFKADDFKMGEIAGAIGALNYEDAQPLLEELLNCCTRITESGAEMLCNSQTIDGYVESVKTLLNLRLEVLKLHFDFFQNASNSPKDTEAEVITFSKTI